MTRSSFIPFLSVQGWTLFSVAFLIGVYQMKVLPERTRRSHRIFLIVTIPPYLLVVEVVAFSILLAPTG